ncbi:hypothetical protein HJC23_002642 [Cyclotella cryptica]|uniref:SAP domain-containing protein n=1 Tax=Cyclotella cryptica TaxID=29204 RepID=A0ABD3PL86_9STRA|eukprot:CCRYP_013535-RA/>CCRYP_013535-RA protein AED:0.00 eAED:0.00 QI:175/-1/1/1/-1/1/1/88/831
MRQSKSIFRHKCSTMSTSSDNSLNPLQVNASVPAVRRCWHVSTKMYTKQRRYLAMILFVSTLSMLSRTTLAFTASPSTMITLFRTKHACTSTHRTSNFGTAASRNWGILTAQSSDQDDAPQQDDGDEEEWDSPPIIDGFDLDDNDSSYLSEHVLNSMTVTQLKQQLRLRGKKVTGNKAELVKRLMDRGVHSRMVDMEGSPLPAEDGVSSRNKAMETNGSTEGKESKRVIEAKAKGADIIDVTEFVEAEDVGKSFRSSHRNAKSEYDDAIDVDTSDKDGSGNDSSSSVSSPEVWGEDARIVEDYEGRSVVVDGLSRTVIEYKGSNDTIVQAYVVGSRDSLAKFLRGGQQQDKSHQDGEAKSSATKYSSIEEEVYAIQRKRELENKRTLPREDEIEGEEDEDDPGTPYKTIERDPGDWGVFTPTGAQLSSSEVQGVLLLSDVYGPFTENTRALADKIAFECQPVVVLAPDMFRGKPWTQNPITGEDGVERNENRKTYEEWRAMHPERRVDVDIRAAASVLRERYDVASIAVWGTCFGGGRALEAASGWYHGGPESYYNDAFSDRPPPPHVDPVACIAWYPTRYDAKKLFGKENEGFRTFENGNDRDVAVMAVFAEHDSLPGATIEDATLLKACLDEDPRVKDAMVKIFPNQNHGFAHNLAHKKEEVIEGSEPYDLDSFTLNDGYDGSCDAEVACLLSTAWMETYTRVFLPTVGSPVRFDEDESWSTVQMSPYSQKEKRDIRKELEEAIANYEGIEIDFNRMSTSSSDFLDDIPEQYKEIEEEREKIKQMLIEKYHMSPDDEEEVFERKLQQAIDDGALNSVMLDAYLDGDAYW